MSSSNIYRFNNAPDDKTAELQRLHLKQAAWLRRIQLLVTPAIENIINWVKKAIVKSSVENPDQDQAKLLYDAIDHVMKSPNEKLLTKISKHVDDIKIAMHSFVKAQAGTYLISMESSDKYVIAVPSVPTFFRSVLRQNLTDIDMKSVDPVNLESRQRVCDWVDKSIEKELFNIVPPNLFETKAPETATATPVTPDPIPVQKEEETLPPPLALASVVEEKKEEDISDVKFVAPEAPKDEAPIEAKLDVQSNPQFVDETVTTIKPEVLPALDPEVTQEKLPLQEEKIESLPEIKKEDKEEKPIEEKIESVSEEKKVEEEVKEKVVEEKANEDKKVEEKSPEEEDDKSKSSVEESPSQSESVVEKKDEETPKSVIDAVEEIKEALNNSPDN